jgi:hypothetical protein
MRLIKDQSRLSQPIKNKQRGLAESLDLINFGREYSGWNIEKS